jgi:diketogulonate reductase-like aldo/keto reductase
MNANSARTKPAIKQVRLPAGEQVSAFGMGTWNMGDDPAARKEEIATLRLGFESGALLVDTAEMYGDGRAEELVGEAIAGHREGLFLVTKVLPTNASRQGTIKACERSLRRLKTDRIDLYLLHWRGNIPFSETLEAFTQLRQTGKIRFYGVSNLDLGEMKELFSAPGGREVQTNQLLYNLSRRNIEWDLLPWMHRHRMPVMAYSPIEQGRLLEKTGLCQLAAQWGLTPSQVALGWLLAKPDIIVIPKTGRRDRFQENFTALEHRLTPEQLSELDKLFPPPSGPTPLEML